MYFGGILGVLIFVLDIIAIIDVLKRSMDPIMKLVWIVVILALPLLGMLLYFLIGRKAA